MIKKISISDFKNSSWSGGSTDEIYIHPENSNFKSGNFEARVSLAKVDKEDSLFTPLPNTVRTLTVLEGNHFLSVNDRGFVPVHQYTPVTFNGGDKTESKGKALNFNFMKKTNNPHEVNIMQAGSSEKIILIPKYKNTLVFIISGKANTAYGKLSKHEAIVFDEEIFIDLESECLFAKVDF